MKTAGEELIELLSKQLGPHMQWTEAEQVLLGNIKRAEDRRAVFATRFAESAAKPNSSTARLVTLSGECRLLETAIARWIAALDPGDNQAKSQRHVAAANARWHRSGT